MLITFNIMNCPYKNACALCAFAYALVKYSCARDEQAIQICRDLCAIDQDALLSSSDNLHYLYEQPRAQHLPTLNSGVMIIHNSTLRNCGLKSAFPNDLNYKATLTSIRYPRARCGGIIPAIGDTRES